MGTPPAPATPSPALQGPLPPSHLLPRPAGPQTLGPRGQQARGGAARGRSRASSAPRAHREARGRVTESPTRTGTSADARTLEETTSSTRGTSPDGNGVGHDQPQRDPEPEPLPAATGNQSRLSPHGSRTEQSAPPASRAHAPHTRSGCGRLPLTWPRWSIETRRSRPAAGTRQQGHGVRSGPRSQARRPRAPHCAAPGAGLGATAPQWSHRSQPSGSSVAGLLAQLPAGHGLGRGPLWGGLSLPSRAQPRPPPPVSGRPLAALR